MAAFADKTLHDDAYTYTPSSTGATSYLASQIDANGVAKWFTAEDVFDSSFGLSMSVRRPVKGSQVARVTIKLVHPVMDTVDATLKIGDCIANVEFVLPKRSTDLQRKTLLSHMAELLANDSDVWGAVESLISPA